MLVAKDVMYAEGKSSKRPENHHAGLQTVGMVSAVIEPYLRYELDGDWAETQKYSYYEYHLCAYISLRASSPEWTRTPGKRDKRRWASCMGRQGMVSAAYRSQNRKSFYGYQVRHTRLKPEMGANYAIGSTCLITTSLECYASVARSTLGVLPLPNPSRTPKLSSFTKPNAPAILALLLVLSLFRLT